MSEQKAELQELLTNARQQVVRIENMIAGALEPLPKPESPVISAAFIVDAFIVKGQLTLVGVVELQDNAPMLMQYRKAESEKWIDLMPAEESSKYGAAPSPHYQERRIPAGKWEVRAIDPIGGTYATSSTVVGSEPVLSDEWDNHEAPVKMTNVQTLYVSNNSPVSRGTNKSTGTKGEYYKYNLNDASDYIIRMDPTSGPLTKGLVLVGGGHVRCVGLEWSPVIQPGCDIGETYNHPAGGAYPDYSMPSFNPRLPSEGKFLHLQNNGDMFIEGMYVDAEGFEGDIFVTRNQLGGTYPQFKPSKNDDKAAKDQATRRRFFLVNSVVKGWTSLSKWKNKDKGGRVEDGFHGDLFQNQYSTKTDFENVGTFVMENVTVANYGNGITHQRRGNHQQRLSFRNVNWTLDKRWGEVSPRRPRSFGVVYWGYFNSMPEFDNFYIDDSLQSPYLKVMRGGDAHRYGPYHEKVAGLKAGTTEDYATKANTGLNYVSPWD